MPVFIIMTNLLLQGSTHTGQWWTPALNYCNNSLTYSNWLGAKHSSYLIFEILNLVLGETEYNLILSSMLKVQYNLSVKVQNGKNCIT